MYFIALYFIYSYKNLIIHLRQTIFISVWQVLEISLHIIQDRPGYAVLTNNPKTAVV